MNSILRPSNLRHALWFLMLLILHGVPICPSAKAACGTDVVLTVGAASLEGKLSAVLNGTTVEAEAHTTPPCYAHQISQSSTISLLPNTKYLMTVTWNTSCIDARSLNLTNSCGCYSVIVENWAFPESNTTTNGTGTADVYLLATNTVILSPSTIAPDKMSTAVASLSPDTASRFATNVTWKVLDPSLGCTITTVSEDTRSCIVRSGDTNGTVVIQATDANGCVALGTLELGCSSCGSECVIGNVSASLNSAQFEISLGRDDYRQTAGALMLKFNLPSGKMYSPSSLVYNASAALDKSVSILTNANGVIQQARAPEGIAVVNIVSTNKYTVSIFNLTNIIGFTNGLYQIAGGASEVSKVTIENPDSSWTTTNKLRATKTKDGNNSIYDFEYATNTWRLSTGAGLRDEYLSSTTSGAIRTDIRTVSSGSTTVSVQTRKYETFSWGEALVEEVSGSGAAARTNTYSYYTNGLMRLETHHQGGWKYYVYDSSGRATNIFSGWLNQTPTTNSSLCRATSYSYASNSVPGSQDNSLFYPTSPRMTVDYVKNVEVARSYSTFTNGTRRDYRCVTALAPWTAADNLETITRYFTSGPNRDRVRTIIRPDWTVDFYEYFETTNTFTTVVHSGVSDWDFVPDVYEDSPIWHGTIVTNVVDRFGRPISQTELIVSALGWTVFTNSSELYSSPDSFGRPRRVDYFDGTWTYTDYGCCGQTTFTNREGTVTTTSYDAVDRLLTTTTGGIIKSNVLDAAGNELALVRIGADGSKITMHSNAYNTAGEVVSEVDGAGKSTTHTNYIDGSGYWVNETLYADNGTRVMKYFKDGQLYSVSGTAVSPLTYSYSPTNDGQGVMSRSEQRGSTTEWNITTTDMLGRHFRTTYAAASGPFPSKRSYYDTDCGQLSKEVAADGQTTLYWPVGLVPLPDAFDATIQDVVGDKDQDGVIDRDGTDRIHRSALDYVYDADRELYLHRTRQYEWYADGADSMLLTITKQTAAGGLRSWTIAYGLTNETWTAYGGSGMRYVTNRMPDGTLTLQTFVDGRLSSSQTVNGALGTLEHLTYCYDSHGRLNRMTNLANGTVTSLLHDNEDRVLTNSVSAAGLTAQTTSFGYDARGRVLWTLHPDGKGVTNEYFVTGYLKKTTGARAYPVEYAYDSQGRVTNMTTWQNYASQSGAAKTAWNYDLYRGWLTNKAYADGKGPSYLYTASGRPSKRVWARGLETTYMYSTLGDLEKIIYSDTNTPSMTNTYDRRGRKVAIRQALGTNWLSYHDSGLLSSESFGSVVVTNVFDDLLRRTSSGIINGSGTWLTMCTNGYDAASRLTTVSDRTNSANYFYLATNRLVRQISFSQSGAERMSIHKRYDGLSRLTSIAASNGVNGIFAAANSAYGAANERSSVTNADNSRWVYQYDNLGQVTSGRKYWSDGTPVAGEQFDYTFDDIGNRKTAATGGDQWGANLKVESYSANSLNQYSQRTVPGYVNILGAASSNSTVTINLQGTYRKGDFYRGELRADTSAGPAWLQATNVGVLNAGSNPDIVTTNTGSVLVPQSPEVYAHDSDGNLVTNGLWIISWNGENRSTNIESRASVATGAKRKVETLYDYLGRRVQSIISTNNGMTWTSVQTNRFVYDGWNLLAEFNGPNNSLIRSYLWGLDLSGSRQGAGGVGGLLAVNAQASGVHFVGYDANGNVTSLSSASNGTQTASYEYSPFGQLLIADGSMARKQPYRFSSKYHDEETSTLYYGYRDYDTETGRWLSQDPLGERRSLSLYTLVFNNPYKYVDRLGLEAVPDIPFPAWKPVVIEGGLSAGGTVVAGTGAIEAVAGAMVLIPGAGLMWQFVNPPPSSVFYPPPGAGYVNAPPAGLFVTPDGEPITVPRNSFPPIPPSDPPPIPPPSEYAGPRDPRQPHPKRTCELRTAVPPNGMPNKTGRFNPCSKCWRCIYRCTGNFYGGGNAIERFQVGGCGPQITGFVPGHGSQSDCEAAADAGNTTNPIVGIEMGDLDF